MSENLVVAGFISRLKFVFSQEWAFLSHMHPFLQRQELNYTIFIVEQAGGGHVYDHYDIMIYL
jgi:hypothetical protein